MQIAPPSWRAAKKRAPASRIALVTVRLPLPSSPKTVSTPSATSALPIASATSMARRSADGPAEQQGADHGQDGREDRDPPAEAREQREQAGDHGHEAEDAARQHEIERALLAGAARGAGSGSALEIAHGTDHAKRSARER